ncbi:MAG: cupin domain-containing protein [Proteobacteria bacterium]|nr:MAG: cupin domain-containing protein [Pseudomonadota bacterium]QKK10647.1 MAG: cupin domain-containing protein [Pseudomonadota bacterium]
MAKVANFDSIRRIIAREGVDRRVFSGKNSTVVMNEIQASACPAIHSHPHEQITYILLGECEFYLGDETIRMSKGDVVLVPSNVKHGLRPLGDTPILNLDVFSPIREDYLVSTGDDL